MIKDRKESNDHRENNHGFATRYSVWKNTNINVYILIVVQDHTFYSVSPKIQRNLGRRSAWENNVAL